MDKLVKHIKMDMPGFPKQGLYCYGEASFEANQAMQEPLEKLYKYENQPDMREKVMEYIGEKMGSKGVNVQIVKLPMVVWIHRTVLIVEEKWVGLKIAMKFKGDYYG